MEPENWRPSFSVTPSAKALILASVANCHNSRSRVLFIAASGLRNDGPMHRALLLRARAFVLQNQPLSLVFAGSQSRFPHFRVVIELHFQKWQIAENIFRILWDEDTAALQG